MDLQQVPYFNRKKGKKVIRRAGRRLRPHPRVVPTSDRQANERTKAIVNVVAALRFVSSSIPGAPAMPFSAFNFHVAAGRSFVVLLPCFPSYMPTAWSMDFAHYSTLIAL